MGLQILLVGFSSHSFSKWRDSVRKKCKDVLRNDCSLPRSLKVSLASSLPKHYRYLFHLGIIHPAGQTSVLPLLFTCLFHLFVLGSLNVIGKQSVTSTFTKGRGNPNWSEKVVSVDHLTIQLITWLSSWSPNYPVDHLTIHLITWLSS